LIWGRKEEEEGRIFISWIQIFFCSSEEGRPPFSYMGQRKKEGKKRVFYTYRRKVSHTCGRHWKRKRGRGPIGYREKGGGRIFAIILTQARSKLRGGKKREKRGPRRAAGRLEGNQLTYYVTIKVGKKEEKEGGKGGAFLIVSVEGGRKKKGERKKERYTPPLNVNSTGCPKRLKKKGGRGGRQRKRRNSCAKPHQRLRPTPGKKRRGKKKRGTPAGEIKRKLSDPRSVPLRFNRPQSGEVEGKKKGRRNESRCSLRRHHQGKKGKRKGKVTTVRCHKSNPLQRGGEED